MEAEEQYLERGEPVDAGVLSGEQVEVPAEGQHTAAGWYTAFVFPCQPQPLYRATQEYASECMGRRITAHVKRAQGKDRQ